MQRTYLRRPDELTADQVASWRRIQQSQPHLDSPYFTPDFTQAVGRVREDVEVAVLEDRGRPVGFFPFQRGNFNIARPVGGPLSDFQGLIVENGMKWHPKALLADCRLSAWKFDHLLAAQPGFAPYTWQVAESPYLDLSNGFAHYEAERRRAQSCYFGQALRKARKIQRDLGPLTFIPHTCDESVFETLLKWKSAQYRNSSISDVLGYEWTVELLRNILARQEADFAGMLSALYVGDRLAAVHLSMRSNRVIHCWFPAYDVQLTKYSVGLILLVELARAAESLGVHRIDLGKGSEQYKRDFMSASTMVAEGSVERNSLAYSLRSGWHRTRQFVKSSPMAASARRIARWLRPAHAWLELR